MANQDLKRPVWPRVAVMGAGAVGCYFGGMLARAGAPVTLIARAQHVAAIRRDGLRFEGVHFQENIPLAASAEPGAVRGAQWVLFCVKSVDTEAAAEQIAPHLDPGAIVLAMQNGVDNIERIRRHLPNPVLAAVVYVAAAMSGPGVVRHTGRGDLVIGELANPDGHASLPARRIDEIAALLARADIPCRVSDNVEGELWQKLLLNCAYNAISALGRAQYERIAAAPEALAVMRAAVREVLDVARAGGVKMPPGDMVDAAVKLADAMPKATSSTAQDIARGKLTEIDHLNGYVFRRGLALGVATPVNQTLHALVKLLENAHGPASS